MRLQRFAPSAQGTLLAVRPAVRVVATEHGRPIAATTSSPKTAAVAWSTRIARPSCVGDVYHLDVASRGRSMNGRDRRRVGREWRRAVPAFVCSRVRVDAHRCAYPLRPRLARRCLLGHGSTRAIGSRQSGVCHGACHRSDPDWSCCCRSDVLSTTIGSGSRTGRRGISADATAGSWRVPRR